MTQSPCPKTIPTDLVIAGRVQARANRSIWRFLMLAGLAVLSPIGADIRALTGEKEPQTIAVDRLGPLALSPPEEQLLADARDGRWNEHSLFAAALAASGAQAAENLYARMEYALLVDRLHASIDPQTPAAEQAEATLRLLHERLFRGGYDLQATGLPDVFRSGRFNCVSATVLFTCLGRDAGLSVRAVKQPHHTQSIVLTGERSILVDATCADWLEVQQSRPLESLAASKATGADSNLSQAAGGYRLISDVALVAMIYYNRGVEALRQGDLQKAIWLNRLALLLDADNADARGNLLSAINKRALKLAAGHHYEAAIELIDTGLAIAPDHRPLIHNRALVEQRRRQTLEGAAN